MKEDELVKKINSNKINSNKNNKYKILYVNIMKKDELVKKSILKIIPNQINSIKKISIKFKIKNNNEG